MEELVNEGKRFCACGCNIELSPTQNRFKHGHNCRGPNNHRWKGGRAKTTQGYIEVQVSDHPLYNKNRPYILEHRVIWEKYNKACLLPWANVHHDNEVKTDNRPENLTAMTIGDHTSMHFVDPTISQRLCDTCGQKTYFRKWNQRYEWYRNPEDKQKHMCRKCFRRWSWRVRGRS